ncbi:hypothetical protein [Henriciella aquimarina]|uniref:hypothetical protein n=1 Tax=Henriciella aquimarina TaxID=545261 RepID=UPI0009FE1DC8|nr:hypothetical protein [Henriciella aquimarina]
MARPAGVRNTDYEEKRAALVNRLTDYLLSDDIQLPSFRQLAIAAETSQPTLNHYFGGRTGAIIAVIEELANRSTATRDRLRLPAETVSEAVDQYTTIAIQLGKDNAYLNSHVLSIREGMTDPRIFEAYNTLLVEPGVAAIAERLVHSKGGPANYGSALTAAHMLMSSSMFMALRKKLLGTVTVDIQREITLIGNWLKHGMLNDPDGANLA